MYATAIAGPRSRMWRCSQLTGPDIAIARNVAITIHPSGRRSRYSRYSVRTTPTTIRTLRTISRGADSEGGMSAARSIRSGPDGLARRPAHPSRPHVGPGTIRREEERHHDL